MYKKKPPSLTCLHYLWRNDWLLSYFRWKEALLNHKFMLQICYRKIKWKEYFNSVSRFDWNYNMPRISNMKLQINAQNMLLCNRSYILLGFNCVQSCIDHKLLHVRYRSYICRQFGTNVAVCKRSVENNHDSSFCLWEPCLNFYVETVSNNTGKLCIHILFVHRKNTTFTGCKPFFISLFVYKIYFKSSN